MRRYLIGHRAASGINAAPPGGSWAGEEPDACKGHVDGCGHVVGIAACLRANVASLRGGDQTGGQLIGIGVGAKLPAHLHSSQRRGHQSPPFGQVTGQLDTGVFAVLRKLDDPGSQYIAESVTTSPARSDQVIPPFTEAGDCVDVGEFPALIGEKRTGSVVRDGTHWVFPIGTVSTAPAGAPCRAPPGDHTYGLSGPRDVR